MSVVEKPTMLILQGAYQTPLVYSKLFQGLLAKGYPTIHPALPSTLNPEDPAFPSLEATDDTRVIQAEIARLVEKEGKAVFVVMHSYGGLLGCESISEELTWAKRREKGLSGGVFHLFFFAAFVFEEGQSFLNTFGESPHVDHRPDGRAYLKPGLLYNGLPEAEIAYWDSQLIPQSYAVQKTALTRASWKYVPSTYLLCEEDMVMPVAYQEIFAKQAGSTVERCKAGHSPMLSMPDLLVDKIVEAAEKAVAELA